MPTSIIQCAALRAKVLRYQELASYYAQCAQPNGRMDQRLSASYYAMASKYRDAMLDAER